MPFLLNSIVQYENIETKWFIYEILKTKRTANNSSPFNNILSG